MCVTCLHCVGVRHGPFEEHAVIPVRALETQINERYWGKMVCAPRVSLTFRVEKRVIRVGGVRKGFGKKGFEL